jgi:hypothetical protein
MTAATADRRLIGRPQVARLVGVTVKTLKGWVERGLFPPPVPGIGVRARWDPLVVEAALRGEWPGAAAAEKVTPRRRRSGR